MSREQLTVKNGYIWSLCGVLYPFDSIWALLWKTYFRGRSCGEKGDKGEENCKKKGKINLQYYLWWKIKKREGMQKIAAGKL